MNVQDRINKESPYNQYLLFRMANVKDSKPREDSFVAVLRDRVHSASFTEQSYRIIHTWEESGLIDAIPNSDKKWRKFNLLELLWINIISQLREFGVPLQKIEVAKKSLFYAPDGDEWYTLDFAIWQILQDQKYIKLLIFPDGKAFLREENELIFDGYDIQGNYIHLNFSNLVKEVFNKPELQVRYDSFILKDSEQEVLKLVRSGDYSKVEITTKDGEIERYNATEHIDADKRIGELLTNKKNGFETITLEKADGKVVSITRTIKEKVR